MDFTPPNKSSTRIQYHIEMKKNEPKPPTKKTNTFSNAMSSMNEMCYDYGKLGMSEGAQRQVFAGKKPQIVSSKKEEQQKSPIKQPNNFQPLVPPPKPKTQCLKLSPAKLQPKALSQFVVSYSPQPPSPPPLATTPQQLPASTIASPAKLQFAYYPQQVKQGGLGDCYLISAVSCLAHRDNILNRCIDYLPPELINSAVEFPVRLFQSGVSTKVIVKNSFPVGATKQPLYAKPIDGDISVMLLEKAYAQMYGGWENIHLGFSCDALRDLCGAPTEYLDLEKEEEVRQKVALAFQQDFVLTISSKADKIPDSELIRPKHSYSIHAYKILTLKNKDSLFVLKLKNPAGGKFPVLLPQFTNQVLDLLKEPPIQQDGIFWMSFKRIRANFQVITSCMIHVKYQYSYKTFGQKELDKNNAVALLLRVQENMHGYVTLHQKHSRNYIGTDYKYQVGKVIVASVKKDEDGFSVVETKVGNFGCKQTCTAELSLAPGDYVVYCQLNSVKKCLPPKQIFTVSFYTSTNKYDLFSCQSIKPDSLLINYIKSHQKEFIVNRSEKLLRVFGTLFGYVIIYYQNYTKKNVVEDIEYESTNVTIESKKAQMGPLGTKLIKNMIGRDNNCSHKCKINSKTVFKG